MIDNIKGTCTEYTGYGPVWTYNYNLEVTYYRLPGYQFVQGKCPAGSTIADVGFDGHI